MAKTIANFLVGVGLETKEFEKGAHKVDTGLGGFRAKAGIAGSAITAAFSVVGAVAIDAGKRLDELALRTEKFTTSTRFINDYGNALRMLGGDASEAVDAIASAEKALDTVRLKGNMGPFQDAVFAGLSPKEVINSKDGEEFLRKLSDIVPKMSKEQQRLLQDSFGFSDATMRSLREGGTKFDALVAKAATLSGDFDKATDAARKYNEQIALLGVAFDGIGNSLAAKVLPGFTGLLETFNKFLSENKDKVGAAIDYAGNNAGSVAAIGAGGAAMAGGTALKLAGGAMKSGALTKVGALTAGAGGLGTAVGVGSMLYDLKASDIKNITGYDVSKYYRAPSETVAAIGDWWGKDKKAPPKKKSPPIDSVPPPVARWMTGGYDEVPRDVPLTDWTKQTDVKPRAENKAAISSPVRDWVTASDAANSSPEVSRTRAAAQTPRPTANAAQPTIKNDIALRVELGGKALESKITQVIERREYDAYVDAQSTEVR